VTGESIEPSRSPYHARARALRVRAQEVTDAVERVRLAGELLEHQADLLSAHLMAGSCQDIKHESVDRPKGSAPVGPARVMARRAWGLAAVRTSLGR
jgi:hypothetical protein